MGIEVLFHYSDPANSNSEDCPRFPGALLTKHVVLKGVQMGTLLGTFAAAPVFYGVCTGVVSPGDAWKTWGRYCAYGAVGGAGFASAALVKNAISMDVVAVEDKAYRILHNKRQVSVDWLSGAGAIAGAGAAVSQTPYAFAGTQTLQIASGMSAGIGASTLVFIGSLVVAKMLVPKDEKVPFRQE
mmetsp:Transcript_15166/g.20928  ORF Transcript_15166/g.20928 Transcript_15166/m.20928 type:complete len:185 (-) Transcript_15166:123-677(-)|eukprot:CAMPEP_0196590096 /NCGR_PEP_ID=MMETSP1081-20130531/65560_1 /TAXON_ID=36882 /ORGANISM="Pyramimonas amylifera, Strain CCMP720" /LENGTH=184 /DNA_ID=CAMNT_0041913091 /DNA_START=111 /DNA_END=665 /DNA_ORIENTATION=+